MHNLELCTTSDYQFDTSKFLLNLNSLNVYENTNKELVIHEFLSYLYNLVSLTNQQINLNEITNIKILEIVCKPNSVFPIIRNEFYLKNLNEFQNEQNQTLKIENSYNIDLLKKIKAKSSNTLTPKIVSTSGRKIRLESVKHVNKASDDEIEIVEVKEKEIKKPKQKTEDELLEEEIKEEIRNIENVDKHAEESAEKKYQRQREDKVKEMKNIFRHDKMAYNIIKKEIEEGKRNPKNIPLLFSQKWGIYRILDDQELFDTKYEWIVYKLLYYETIPNDDHKKPYWNETLTQLTKEEEKIFEELPEEKQLIIYDYVESTNNKPIEDLIEKKLSADAGLTNQQASLTSMFNNESEHKVEYSNKEISV